MKLREYFDAGILQAEDLPADGITLTIVKVEQGDLETEDEDKNRVSHKKPLVSFRGTKTQWAMNVHNRVCLEAMFGDDDSDIIGHQVTLAQQPCEYKGLYYQTPAIRVIGSPELTAPITLTVGKSSRRKGVVVELTKTTVKAPPVVDPVSGEVHDDVDASEAFDSTDTATEPTDAPTAPVASETPTDAPPAEPLSTNPDRSKLSDAVKAAEWSRAELATHITLTYDGAEGPQALTRTQIAECIAYVKTHSKAVA